MANEIQINASLAVTLGGSTVQSSRPTTLTISGNEALTHMDVASESADSALPLATLDTLGYILVENLDATNFILISEDTGGSFAGASIIKIRPGCSALFQPVATTLYIKADTAAVKFRVTAVEV